MPDPVFAHFGLVGIHLVVAEYFWKKFCQTWLGFKF